MHKFLTTNWTGRYDGDAPELHRWHQRVCIANEHYSCVEKGGIGFLGFAVDEGVLRNLGRVGAAKAPNIIRGAMSNFPAFEGLPTLTDWGDVRCADKNLEKSQQEYGNWVEKILHHHDIVVGLGGGHEIVFAQYQGIRKKFPEAIIGIINFDAHFDNRTPNPEIGATSGTSFYQILSEDKHLRSLTLGIQSVGNTMKLFQTARELNMKFHLADDFFMNNLQVMKAQVVSFLTQVDALYVTVCMDVFAQAFAPGVSAPTAGGIFPDGTFYQIFDLITSCDKLIAFDVAEVNPEYDSDLRTAKLAAHLIFRMAQNQYAF